MKEHPGFHCGVISYFDGMHHQHRALLEYGLKLAGGEHSRLLVVVVQDKGLSGGQNPGSLLSPEERGSMIEGLGYKNIVLAGLPGHSFRSEEDPIMEIVAGKTGLLIPGVDGVQRGREQERHPLDLLLKQFPGLRIDQGFSRMFEKDFSPEIARLIAEGNMWDAFQKAGYAYFLNGQVVEGNKIGRTLGYPTANLKPEHPEKVEPGQGVYAALVKVEGEWYQSMVNIGIRPTLDLENVTIEAHLFDFDKNIYGQEIAIHFLHRIRDEMRFTSLSELKEQLKLDQTNTLDKLSKVSKEIVRTGNFIFSLELPAKEK